MTTKIKKKVTLAAKQSFVERTRSSNYNASLKLEGFNIQTKSRKKTVSKEELISKYKAA